MSRVLSDFACPRHRCELLLWFDVDGDETGVWPVQWWACPIGDEVFRAEPDGMGSWVPVVEDDEP